MEHTLTIQATGKYGTKGERYEVFHGAEQIAVGTSPEFAACRLLKDRGFTGFVRFARPGKPHHLRMGIEWGATHCVLEGQKQGVRFAKWEPNPLFAGNNPEDEALATVAV